MKKGFEFSVLVMLIITLIGGLLLLYYMYTLGIQFEKKTDIEACRLSIIADAKTEQSTLSLLTTSITCPAEYAVIDRKNAASEIARLMKNCWYKVGEGKIPVFGRAWTKEKSSCLVSSEFILNENLDTKEIKDYLSNNMPSSDITYLDYFGVLGQQKAPSPDMFFVDVGSQLGEQSTLVDTLPLPKPVPQQLIEFAKEKPYFVLFVRQQLSYIQNLFSTPTWIVSSIIGKITGEQPLEDAQTFFIVPRDKVAQLKVDNAPLCKDLYWERGGDYGRK